MKHAIAFALLVAATPAAAVITNDGNQFIEDFEGRAPGPVSISFLYDLPDDDFGVLSGGSVTLASPAFPATSPGHVYVGTRISFVTEWGLGIAWSAVSAIVSGTAPIRLRTWSFDGTPDDRLVNDIWTTGNDVSTVLGVGGETDWQAISRLEYSSAAEFAMDDFRIGSPNSPIGIPEPASWAMLIAGFGMTGAAMRRVNARRTSAPTG